MKAKETMSINFWFLWSGFVISTCGTYTSLIVINLFIYDITKSPLFVGLFLLGRLIPSFIIGSFAGAVADRRDRRTLMIGADLTRAILILSVIFLRQHLYLLYVIFFLISCADRFYQASMGGGLPNLVGKDKIIQANSYLAAGRTISIIAGPLLGGILASFNRYDVAFGMDAATYLISASLLSFIGASMHEAGRTAAAGRSWWRDVKVGYGYVFARFSLAGALFVRSMDAFGSSALNVGLPVLATSLQGFRVGIRYGMFYGAFGIGEMLGALFLARRIVRVPPERLICISIAVMAVAFGVALCAENFWTSIAFLAVCGGAEGVTVVHYNTLVQKNPDEVRGRVVGISETCVWSAMAIGMFLSGLLMQEFGLRATVAGFSFFTVVSTAVVLVLDLRRSKTSQIERVVEKRRYLEA